MYLFLKRFVNTLDSLGYNKGLIITTIIINSHIFHGEQSEQLKNVDCLIVSHGYDTSTKPFTFCHLVQTMLCMMIPLTRHRWRQFDVTLCTLNL